MIVSDETDPAITRSLWKRSKDAMKKRISDSGDKIRKHIILALLVLTILLPAVSLAKVDPTQTGLAYNQVQAKLSTELLQEGLQSIPSFGRAILWPKKYESVEFSDTEYLQCNTRDGMQVTLDASFQYVPQADQLYSLTLKFQDFKTYQGLVRSQGAAAIVQSCGEFTAEEFQTLRSDVADEMEHRVTTQLEARFRADVARFQLRDIARPTRYEDTVKDKENARSDIRLAENERKQALTKANTDLDVAGQEAQRTIDSANTEARIIETRATKEAEGVVGKYQATAEVYASIKETNNLTVTGILSFISNEVFSSSGSVLAGAVPSQINFLTEV